MENVTSQEKLFQHLDGLKSKYSARGTAQSLLKTNVLVAQLRSFTQIITIFVQSNDIASLVWGPLALIFELAYRHQETVDMISDVLERVEQALPRFQEYLREFGSRSITTRFQEALVVYYAELIAHYQDSIKFLRAHPLKNVFLLHRSANKFNLLANRRLERLRDLTRSVEKEVDWLKYQTQQTQHKQVVHLLQATRTTTMALQLPFRDFPYSRNFQFCFRDQLLIEMHNHLDPGTSKKTTLRTTSLVGLGGVGKTQVALEFAYRHTPDFDAIFWVKAETEAKIRESICNYARAMQDDTQSGPQQDAVLIKRFKSWLMTPDFQGSSSSSVAPRWLLIFDNVDDLMTLQPFWPGGAHGSVIITTRDATVARHFGQQAIEVPLFTKDESVQFMFKINPGTEKKSPEELKAVQIITDRLGHLPLVLRNIGGYTSSIATSYQIFLQHYSDFDHNLLFQKDTSNTTSYEASVSTTWTMTLSQIDPMAKELMEIIALFDPDSIPIELIESWDIDDNTDKAISILFRGSLISRSSKGDQLSCHRIIREAVLQSLDPNKFVVLFDWAVFSLNALFPKTPGGAPLLAEWDACAIYHNHLSSLLNLYLRFASSLRPPVLLCEVIRRCAWYLCERGNFTDALELVKMGSTVLEDAAAICNYPGYYPQYMCRLTADLYSSLGSIEYELNHPNHGRLWFEKADEHRRKLIDNDTAQSYDIESMAVGDGNIGLSHLADSGTSEPSIAAYKFLIENFQNNNNLCIWAANLSIAYRFQGDLEESLEWCKVADNWTRKTFGEDSLSMAIVHFNVGKTYMLLKEDERAFKVFNQSLQIRQQKAPSHRYTGFTCHQIGVLMRARGDIPGAIASFQSAVRILNDCEAQTGAVLRSKFALSKAFKEIGSFEEGDGLLQEVIKGLSALDTSVIADADADALTDEHFERFVLYCHR
ncbi:uncharacterized protein N7482_009398 [Penicillium canariense]|uniref:NB-ARC domain-containing protein n=1 Tax=Penicillium canariense TaxID=189055 RepID=A0A9W9HQS2_9EURO|nr:uncharacterized protein N7482_009398 [Penicillium canariense]KAJ5152920.1 hypothetical protein N7482_009398 [Penicillium canariense]